jgi:hypothetical protein
MTASTITRERLGDGTVRLGAVDCTYTIVRPRPEVMLLAIRGRETGALGRAAIGEVAVEAARQAPLRLFVDMAELSDVAESVAEDWTAWFQANRGALHSVQVLAPAVFVRLTVAVSQVFSRTGDLITIHTEPAPFEAALRAVSSAPSG